MKINDGCLSTTSITAIHFFIVTCSTAHDDSVHHTHDNDTIAFNAMKCVFFTRDNDKIAFTAFKYLLLRTPSQHDFLHTCSTFFLSSFVDGVAHGGSAVRRPSQSPWATFCEHAPLQSHEHEHVHTHKHTRRSTLSLHATTPHTYAQHAPDCFTTAWTCKRSRVHVTLTKSQGTFA